MGSLAARGLVVLQGSLAAMGHVVRKGWQDAVRRWFDMLKYI